MASPQPQYRFCRYEASGPVVTITINRPEVLNALNPEGHVEMADAFDRYAADNDLRVAVVTGEGDRAFCVGSDLKAIARDGDKPKPKTGFAGITHRFDLWKPVIASVNGLALGGGVEIIGACDIAIAADDAQFGLPEPRVGLAALGGGVLQRLARQMAMKDAMWLALTGERISAQEAQRIRLINKAVPRSDLAAETRKVVDSILKCAPLSIQASKQAMLQSLRTGDLFSTMHENYDLAQRMLNSADAKEGPRAFAEKRPPRWTGN